MVTRTKSSTPVVVPVTAVYAAISSAGGRAESWCGSHIE